MVMEHQIIKTQTLIMTESLIQLKKAGFDGFLIGENFMKSSRPEQAAYNFIKEFKKLAESELSEA